MSTQQLVTSAAGVNIAIVQPYTPGESGGVTALVVAASLSLVCALVLLGVLGVSLLRNRSEPSDHVFVRTHGAAFFTSLMLADVVQAIGSIMSSKWIMEGQVDLGSFCSAQGAIKNAGNLAVSLWTLMLAIHTFCVLFLRMKPKEWSLYATLIFIWLFVGLLVLLGPGAIQKDTDGPYFGISGYWCWISDPYPVSRVLLEYAWMFSAAALSFLLYMLTFLRLRGNITIDPTRRKIKFKRVEDFDPWVWQPPRDPADIKMIAVARGMIGFPILFAILVLPIAVCRFIAWSGKTVPFEATIFADTVFSLMGVFHLILFILTRVIFPRDVKLDPEVSEEVKEHGVQPYNVADFASAHGFNDAYQSEAEKGMTTLPPRTSASLARTPVRPLRPLSLGEVPALKVPHIEDPPVRDQNRAADRSPSPGGQEASQEQPWDVVDLDQSGSEMSASPRQDTFHSRARDTRFTVSAYQYGDDSDSEVPPMPSGAGIDLNAGQNSGDDDEDDRHLMQPNHSKTQS